MNRMGTLERLAENQNGSRRRQGNFSKPKVQKPPTRVKKKK